MWWFPRASTFLIVTRTWPILWPNLSDSVVNPFPRWLLKKTTFELHLDFIPKQLLLPRLVFISPKTAALCCSSNSCSVQLATGLFFTPTNTFSQYDMKNLPLKTCDVRLDAGAGSAEDFGNERVYAHASKQHLTMMCWHSSECRRRGKMTLRQIFKGKLPPKWGFFAHCLFYYCYLLTCELSPVSNCSIQT